MKRVKLIVAYDGTNYHGWQTQPNAVTIEEVLNHHLSELLKEEIKVIGASRTDAGVHALGNVAVFDTSARMADAKDPVTGQTMGKQHFIKQGTNEYLDVIESEVSKWAQ